LAKTVCAQPGWHHADEFVDLLAQPGLLRGHVHQHLVHHDGAALLVGQAGVGRQAGGVVVHVDLVDRSEHVQPFPGTDGIEQRVLLDHPLAVKQGGGNGVAVQFMEYRLIHFLGRAMGLLHHIYGFLVKHALAKAKLLAARRHLQRRRQVVHPPHFLDGDGQRGTVALGEAGLDAADGGVDGAVADALCVVRDGPRFVILGTRK
jgi:hypothetical protein